MVLVAVELSTAIIINHGPLRIVHRYKTSVITALYTKKNLFIYNFYFDNIIYK